jgi:hypothetical protein
MRAFAENNRPQANAFPQYPSDPPQWEALDLLGRGIIPHAAQTETLQRGETLTRSVSEEIGCGPSFTLRVSVETDLGEYNCRNIARTG